MNFKNAQMQSMSSFISLLFWLLLCILSGAIIFIRRMGLERKSTDSRNEMNHGMARK